MSRLARALGVQLGEGSLALGVTVLMLATSLGAATGGAATEALFFARFDVANLPAMYVALGVVTLVVTLGVSVLFAHSGRSRLYLIVLLALAAVLVLERGLVETGTAWVYPAIWLVMNVVATLQGIVVWGVASSVCDARQAKRLFPLFNAGRIAGLVAGGFATATLVMFVHAENLLVVWAASLVVAFTLLVSLLPTRRPALDEPVERKGALAELAEGFAFVRRSDLLRLLTIATVLFSVLYFSLTLPFTRAMRAELVDEDRIAAFLGLFNGATTTAALVLSLVVANRFFARFGIVNAVLIFTAIYLGGFAILGVAAGFTVLVAVRFAQMTWLTGIADPAYQAIFHPIPAERRDQTRAFMAGVPAQAGIALAGIVLFVGDRALEPWQLYLIGLVAAALTVAVLWRARSAYRGALADALRAGRPQPFLVERDPLGVLVQDPAAVGVALAGLTDTDVRTRRVSAEVMERIASAEHADALARAADDADEAVRAAALRGLRRVDPARGMVAARTVTSDAPADLRGDAAVTLGDRDAIARLLTDVEPETREAALRALRRDGSGKLRSLGHPMLQDPRPAIRASAIELLASDLAPDELRPLLEDVEWRVSVAATRALATSGTIAVRALLADFARRERDAALPDIVAPVRTDERAAFVAEILRARARAHALRAISAGLALAGRMPEELVIEALEREDGPQRASALELVESAAEADVVRPLLRLWEDEGEMSAEAVLARAANDADPVIRELVQEIAFGGEQMEGLATLSTMERVMFMKRVPIFTMLPPPDLVQVARIATEHLFVGGTTVALEGEIGDRLYVIVAGALKVVAGGVEIASQSAGDYLGELSLVTRAPRIASLVAIGETRCLCLGRRDFEAIVRDRPEVGLAIIRVLSARLRALHERMRAVT